ncbi:hypothetical protein VTH06DRAFT_5887 [Thermothelomyces fergusii]
MEQNNLSPITLHLWESLVALESVENGQSLEYQRPQSQIDDVQAGTRVPIDNNNNNNAMDGISTTVPLDAGSEEDAFGFTDEEQVEQEDGGVEGTVEAADAMPPFLADGYFDDNIHDIIDNAAAMPPVHGGFDRDVVPAPHVPDVDPIHMYNPAYNPAAAYWSTLPDELDADEFGTAAEGRPRVSLYGDPPLPTFDTDPSPTAC